MRLRTGVVGPRIAAISVGGALVLGAGLTAPAAPAQAVVACAVQYRQDQWPGGMTVNITVRNLGDPLTDWALDFTFPTTGQRVMHGWSATWTQTGRDVTARSLPWNAVIPAGSSATIGFVGSWSSTNPVPTSFAVSATGGTCGPGPVTLTSTTPTTTSTTTTSTTPMTTTTTSTTTPTTTSTTTGDSRLDNPYLGATVYVNPEWSAKAAADGGQAIADQPTAIWLDSIASITAPPGSGYDTGLREHLDNALAQGADLVQVVVYDLPGGRCALLSPHGELEVDELEVYRTEFIDPIAEIEADPKYADLRIVNIIEPNSLPNLLTGTGNLERPECNVPLIADTYVGAVVHALSALHAAGPNVYNYLDAAHHAWLGWETNFRPAAQLFARVARQATGGVGTVQGFVTNTAGYAATREPYYTATTVVAGVSVRQSRWVDWNNYVDELSFATAFRSQLVAEGFDAGIGMLVDTSRNGWGGPHRPDGPSASLDLDTFVDESRIDRRIHASNWCNQRGAGLGARPVADPAPGIDAYVWAKPPGESDGSGAFVPFGPDNPTGKGFDRMCDPSYAGNSRNAYNPSGAMPDAPVTGAWFSAQFHELLANAHPPL